MGNTPSVTPSVKPDQNATKSTLPGIPLDLKDVSKSPLPIRKLTYTVQTDGNGVLNLEASSLSNLRSESDEIPNGFWIGSFVTEDNFYSQSGDKPDLEVFKKTDAGWQAYRYIKSQKKVEVTNVERIKALDLIHYNKMRRRDIEALLKGTKKFTGDPCYKILHCTVRHYWRHRIVKVNKALNTIKKSNGNYTVLLWNKGHYAATNQDNIPLLMTRDVNKERDGKHPVWFQSCKRDNCVNSVCAVLVFPEIDVKTNKVIFQLKSDKYMAGGRWYSHLSVSNTVR